MRKKEKDRQALQKTIAFAGNPNVGKSTIFNALTGMNQHTGNWTGKTVDSAQGFLQTNNYDCTLVDIPGTYSLLTRSAEEDVARDFLCSGKADATIIVCDATCLSRNMNLVLQIMEITENVIVCVNLLDEAKRKNIKINLDLLEERLGVLVIGTEAHNKKSVNKLKSAIDKFFRCERKTTKIIYQKEIEQAVSLLKPVIHSKTLNGLSARWVSLRLLESDDAFKYLKETDETIKHAVYAARETLSESGINQEILEEKIVNTLINRGEEICDGVIKADGEYNALDLKTDKILTGKLFGIPTMLLLLCFIFFLTITVSNYPSAWLSNLFNIIGGWLSSALLFLKVPPWIYSLIMDGIYRVLSWVVAVMLPPMAIFFPLFTILEDIGYLPRIAYNLDCPLKKCHACGKQALTMCMGFGCNAAGVVGCRIIDSPRERLLAILTNSFTPCNGRFPALISIISIFFVSLCGGFSASLLSTVLLTAVILLSVMATLLATLTLSKTILRGVPSSYTLELPPYRKPQITKIIIRSVFDRTLFVLGRAAAIAAPAGMLIWIFSNIKIGDASLLLHCADFLDPFGRLMGLDGIILIAFILGLPANEIVIPLIIMAYTAENAIYDIPDLSALKSLLVQNGWTWVTALCFMIFILMHWPCSTTLLTIKKETGSLKWTLLAAALPTVFGITLCILINLISKIFI